MKITLHISSTEFSSHFLFHRPLTTASTPPSKQPPSPQLSLHTHLTLSKHLSTQRIKRSELKLRTLAGYAFNLNWNFHYVSKREVEVSQSASLLISHFTNTLYVSVHLRLSTLSTLNFNFLLMKMIALK